MNCHKALIRCLLAFSVVGIVGFLACRNDTRPGSVSASPKQSSNDSATNSSKQNSDGRVLVESRESLYNNIYVYQTGTNLSMTFGRVPSVLTVELSARKPQAAVRRLLLQVWI